MAKPVLSDFWIKASIYVPLAVVAVTVIAVKVALVVLAVRWLWQNT